MNRYSSRRDDAFSSILNSKLPNAIQYDRIAGYFSSSLLEIAGEAIDKMQGKIRIICNSELNVDDVKIAQLSLKNEWCKSKPEELPCGERFERLYKLIISGKLEIRVLPDERFGLIHGKAGVITMKDGSKISFLGSINESKNAWKNNYELVWEDDTLESVQWVQNEFDALWNDQYAVDLKNVQYIINDIHRITKRQVVTCDEWRNKPNPADVVVESPIFRKGFGLWEHQKYFINKVFKDHLKSYGARYVLADEVGLGKTVQLALSAQLMCLYGNRPVLIIVPKTLVKQWQDELLTLIEIPSAIWDGKKWIDEMGNEYFNDITKCPRRIGIISQGIISNNSLACKEIKDKLLNNYYEGVICDEAHRARRRNLGDKKNTQSPEMNNLYKFLYDISPKTKSMLLATATPVQMYPIEAFDLLNILSNGNDSILGNFNSKWKNKNTVPQSLKLVTGEETLTVEDMFECWEWIRNPFPPRNENHIFDIIRKNIEINDDNFIIKDSFLDLTRMIKNKLKILVDDDFFKKYNPYIRHIIRRERKALERKINPNTGLPYLPTIKVTLFGEDDDSLILQGYLKDAYDYAEEFCNELKKRSRSGGFIKTLLLRRIGSSVIAGYCTGIKMLKEWGQGFEDNDKDDDEINNLEESELKDLTPIEKDILEKYVKSLEIALKVNEKIDPKYDKVVDILSNGVVYKGIKTKPWRDLGCIIFTQYFDTANWVAKNISSTFINMKIGLYAGGDKSCIYENGIATKQSRDILKQMVKNRELKIIVGTDAASEGLNLQTLGTLINLDLPWNPTKLEQRKGRIQRIGQINPEIFIYNLKYKNSVEDRVHSLLSDRLKNIFKMFGQVPDILTDVWVQVALNDEEEAKKIIDSIPNEHPFNVKYNDDVNVIDWETCNTVINDKEAIKILLNGW